MMWTLYLDFQVGRQILCTVTGAHLAQCTDHIQSQRALVLVGRSARNGYGWMTSFWLSLSSIMHWTKRTTLGLLPQNRYSICFAHLTWCKILKAACYICYIFSITPCKWSSIVWILFPCLPSVWLLVITKLNSFSICPHCSQSGCVVWTGLRTSEGQSGCGWSLGLGGIQCWWATSCLPTSRKFVFRATTEGMTICPCNKLTTVHEGSYGINCILGGYQY